MDKKRLLELIDQPEQITQDDLQQLKTISSAYQSSSLLQMLSLKGLKLHDEFQFHRTLKQRSGLVLNRSELKKLIYPETTAQPEIYFPSIPNEEPVTETVTEQDKPVEKELSVSETKKEKKRKKKEKKKKRKAKQVYPELSISLNQEAEKEQISKEKEATTEEPAITNANPTEVKKAVEVDKEPTKEFAKDEAPEPSEKPTSNSFSSWLSQHSTVDTSHLVTRINVDDEEQNTSEKEPKATLSKKQKTVNELIDTFIETEPKVSRPKPEFFSPVNMGKKSMEDNEEFVSETLAELMASAGHTAKAIRYFEILSLNNPEKRDYFAGRISALKQGKK